MKKLKILVMFLTFKALIILSSNHLKARTIDFIQFSDEFAHGVGIILGV